MPLAFRAQENTQDSQRLQSQLLRHAATVALVDQDAPEPELQGESDGLCLSASQILFQGLNPVTILDRLDHDKTLIDRLRDRLHPRVLTDGLESS